MDTTTLLLKACKLGDQLAVKGIVEREGLGIINVTARCKVSDREFLDATPLFIAAGGGRLEICQYLVDKGANINSRITTQFSDDGQRVTFEVSPLHEALTYLTRDPEYLEGMATVQFLIANGADISASPIRDGLPLPLWSFVGCNLDPLLTMIFIDLNLISPSLPWCPEKGKTVLHHWASRGDQDAVPIFKKLLAKGADVNVLDKFGLTPLIVAAIGYSNRSDLPGNPNESVLRYLLHERDDISLSDKIEALELAGASILLFETDEHSVSRAFQNWNEAEDLRDSAKVPIPKVSLYADNTVLWRSSEWTTRAQLEELKHRPVAEMKMQAFLVTRRILVRISSSFLVNYLWVEFARGYCAILNHENHLTELVEICWLMLEGTSDCEDPSNDDYWQMIIDCSHIIDETLRLLKDQQNPFLNLEMLTLSLKLVFDSMNNPCPQMASFTLKWYPFNHVLHPMKILFQLVSILSDNPEMITPELKSLLEKIVKRDARTRKSGQNLLLYVCHILDASTLPNVRLLLKVGADPNAKTRRGNSPLHYAACRMKTGEMKSPLADLLLENGAHLDQVNESQQTPLDVWKIRHGKAGGILSPPGWMNPVLPLTCCSARVIQRSMIPMLKLPQNSS